MPFVSLVLEKVRVKKKSYPWKIKMFESHCCFQIERSEWRDRNLLQTKIVLKAIPLIILIRNAIL